MLSVQVKRISSRKIQDQLPDYDWSESLDPLSNPHLLEWLRDQERAFQVCPSKTIYCISANSFRGNYSFLNLALCTECGNYSRAETIHGNTVVFCLFPVLNNIKS